MEYIYIFFFFQLFKNQHTIANKNFFSTSFRTQQPGGRVLATFGQKVNSWTNNHVQKYTIERAGPHVPSDARYMFELLKSTSNVHTRVCRLIGLRINNLWSSKSKDDKIITWNVRMRHQEKYRTWGRVCFESEIKQTNPTVFLEGCRKPPKSNSSEAKNWPQVCISLLVKVV